MKRSDFVYLYSDKGYMLTYKGENLGGAGSMPSDKTKHWRHKRADLKMYRELCEREIDLIMTGTGEERFREAITRIDERGKE